MVSEHPGDIAHCKPVHISPGETRMLRLEDQIEDALAVLEQMPNDHKNCTVENYELARSKLRGILNQALEI